MSAKSPPPILLLLTVITVTIAVTVTASPTYVQFDRISSDEPGSTSLCPQSVNPGACPIRCFRADPVCGVDNVTYWCGCPEALCAGVPVAKRGFCDHENGGSGEVSGQALLLVHIVWLVLLGFFVLFGLL